MINIHYRCPLKSVGTTCGGRYAAHAQLVHSEAIFENLIQVKMRMLEIARSGVGTSPRSLPLQQNSYVCPTSKRRDNLRWQVRGVCIVNSACVAGYMLCGCADDGGGTSMRDLA